MPQGGGGDGGSGDGNEGVARGCASLREGENRRWVKNCGERWEGKSDEFFLLAFCLRATTGCPDDYDYSRRVAVQVLA